MGITEERDCVRELILKGLSSQVTLAVDLRTSSVIAVGSGEYILR